ncbi:hypothetical protein [Streptomyces sp. NPDC052042]|uniref:hypothetical protein n=1 Tax=Streptomyces sp. NPDC052042 TaxID=3365683 RepID=UPI0037D87C4F
MVGHITDLADRDVFTMVSTPAVLESVMLDEGGLLTGERVPRVIDDTTRWENSSSATGPTTSPAARARGSLLSREAPCPY